MRRHALRALLQSPRPPIFRLSAHSDVRRRPLRRSFTTTIRWRATPTAAPVSSVDPAEIEAQSLLNEGSSLLEAGDIEGARDCYARSIDVKDSAAARYNHAIALYQLKLVPQAIAEWHRSLDLDPSADAYTNLASAYVLADPPQPLAALEALQEAVKLEPGDAEIRFNLGAVNEANGHLTEALQEYTAARDLGIERAEQNIRNVGAKLLRQRLTEEGGKSATGSDSR